MRHTRTIAICTVIVIVSIVAVIAVFHGRATERPPVHLAASPSAGTTIRPGSYLGVYAAGVPESYAGIKILHRKDWDQARRRRLL